MLNRDPDFLFKQHQLQHSLIIEYHKKKNKRDGKMDSHKTQGKISDLLVVQKLLNKRIRYGFPRKEVSCLIHGLLTWLRYLIVIMHRLATHYNLLV